MAWGERTSFNREGQAQQCAQVFILKIGVQSKYSARTMHFSAVMHGGREKPFHMSLMQRNLQTIVQTEYTNYPTQLKFRH